MSPTLPPAPSLVPPPSVASRPATGGSAMKLVAPSLQEDEQRNWASLVAAVLVTEATLLWLLTCLLLVRRRLALVRLSRER
ncbi:hypothetical protein [Actinomadura vinacea]|uniref:hypothetical protein n=1 Tax=Actinomadura vinacea TaxID=115336 RepID=UPI0031DA75D4